MATTTIQMSCTGADGKAFRLDPKKPDECIALLKRKGTYRYPVEGLTDDKAKAAWWLVERGQPGSMRALVAAAKRTRDPEIAERYPECVYGRNAARRGKAETAAKSRSKMTVTPGVCSADTW